MRIHLILLIFCFGNLLAQELPLDQKFEDIDTSILTYTVKSIKIYSLSEGLSFQTFKEEELAVYQGSSIADLLQRETGVFVKQYGLAMTGTASNRGSSAAHTAVIWEGINILNPMLGQSDLSLLPIFFMDDVSLRSGGGSALDGNNAIGGSIKFSSKTSFNSGWKAAAQFQIGSFGNIQQQMRLSFGNDQYAGSLRFFYQKADNDFRFRDQNAFGSPKPWVNQSNSKQKAFGGMQENSLRINKHSQLNIKNWYQQSYRQIPPNLLQSIGDQEEQWDKAFRNSVSWNLYDPSTSSNWTLRNGFSIERLDYESQVLRSESQIFSNIASLHFLKQISKPSSSLQQILRVQVEHQYQSALSSSYRQSQQQLGLSAFYIFEHQNWRINIIGRQQFIDRQFLRPAVDINGRFSLWNKPELLKTKLFLQIASSYNYRYPTLNDRFWQPGGNPNLLPEYAFSNDIALALEHQFNKNSLQKISIGGFSNLVENWIQWSPEANSSLWTPQNISTVWARGLESKWDWEFESNVKHPIQIKVGASYFFNLATRTKDIEPNLINKQLIYTPQHRLLGRFNLRFRQLSLAYRHHFNSKRYLDNSNTESLPGYQLGWLQLGYTIKLSKVSIAFQVSVDNITGTDYQVVANRAMPRQNFQIGFVLKFL